MSLCNGRNALSYDVGRSTSAHSPPSKLHAWLSDAQQPPHVRMAAQQGDAQPPAAPPQWTTADREFMRLALAEARRWRAVLQRVPLTRTAPGRRPSAPWTAGRCLSGAAAALRALTLAALTRCARNAAASSCATEWWWLPAATART